MNGELVSPNLHVIFVHFPIGLLFTGVLIELFSFLGWRRSGFRIAGRWMILLGALGAVPAALSGVFALQQVARIGIDPVTAGGNWRDVRAATPLIHTHGGESWEHLIDHTWQQGIATGVLLFAVLVWLSSSDRLRIKLHLPIFLLVLFGAGLMSVGAWNGGESVYGHGVAVGIEENHEPTTKPTTASAVVADIIGDHHLPRHVGGYLPPMQMHVIFAGLTISLAVVALGLGIRGATTVGNPVDGMDDLAAALGPLAANDPFISSEQSASLRKASEVSHEHTPPSARFWMLAMLLAIVTAALGIYMLAGPHGINHWDVQELLGQIRNPDQNPAGPFKLTRRLAHVIAGSSVILLTFLLAIFGRFAPRRKFFVLFLGLILLAVAAAQVWVGILLLYDTNGGPLNAFN